MKRLFLFALISELLVMNTQAQVSAYAFSQLTTTYTEITGGTVLGNSTTDEQGFVDPAVLLGVNNATTGPGLPIGFSFMYNGFIYDVFGVNANGWISFGQSTLTPNPLDMSSLNYQTAISTASTALPVLQNRVAAFSRNIAAQTGSELSYETTGTPPNRVLVVQWKGYTRSGATGENINFQIKLYETTNVVELVYGAFTLVYTGSNFPQVGLRGTAETDFTNRTSVSSWNSTAAGALNTATVTISTTIIPPSGLTFRYTPPVIMQYDAGIAAINTPGNIALPGNNPISFTIKNFGISALTSDTVYWSVDGVLQTPYSYTNAGLAHNETDGPILIDSFNFTAAGTHVLKAWTKDPDGYTDQNSANDTTIKTIYIQIFRPIPYYQNFDSVWINESATHDVPDHYWISTPSTGNNSWRRNDDGASAGWTGSGGTYAPGGANNTTNSARFHSSGAQNGTTGTLDLCLNFNTPGIKLLKFWYNNIGGTDSLTVLMSTDCGTTFAVLQRCGTNAAWTLYKINLGVALSTTVVLRFIARSDAGVSDIGLDEVEVTLLPPNDAGISSIDAPSSPVHGNVPVKATIMNFGSGLLNSATIEWSVNGLMQAPYSYVNVTGLPNNSTDGPLTIGNYNFAASGYYTIKAWTSNPNSTTDGDHSNDTSSSIVYAQSHGTIPYYQGFNNTWTNKFSTRDAPDQYWINNPETGNDSWRRNDDSISAAWTTAGGVYAPGGANGTANSARFHTKGSVNGSTGTLNLYLDFSLSGYKLLKFWHINIGGTDSLTVAMSTNGGSTFTVLQNYYVSPVWTEYNIPLGNTVSPDVVLSFTATSNAGQSDIGLDEIQVTIIPQDDAGVVSIDSPSSPASGIVPIAVTVENFGADTLHSAIINWSVNGAIQNPFNYTNVPGLAFSGTDGPDTISNYNFIAGGFYTIKVWTTNPNGTIDGNHSNDTTTAVVFVQGYATLPFTEDFDGPWVDKFSTRDVPSLYWSNIPLSDNASWRRYDDGSAAAWTQPAHGAFSPPGATNTPLSARFHSSYAPSNASGTMDLFLDFTPDGPKALKFWYINPSGGDSLTVYFSSDSGSTFTFLHNYKVDSLWSQKIINLGTSTNPNCILRFIATSDNGPDDIGLDQVQIYIPVNNDAGTTAFLSPAISICGKTGDSVVVVVYNNGLNAITNIPVVAHITTPGGTVLLNDTIPGPLAAGSSDTLFLGTLNTTAPGNYSFTVYTSLTGDFMHSNDTLFKTMTTASMLSIPHVEDFEGATPLANWNTNFVTGISHGNTSNVMYSTMNNGNPKASAMMNKKIGPISSHSVFGFYYRIVDEPTGTPVTLAKDSIFIYLSDDCGNTQDMIFLIDSSNHDPSTIMKHIEIPLTSYAGADVIPSIYIKRANTANYYVDFDNIAIYDPPVANAGIDQTICYTDTLDIVGSIAANYTSLLWTSSGDGSFVDNTIANAKYMPGVNDSASGSVVLTLNAYGPFDTATSLITITIAASAYADAGNDVNICQGSSAQLNATGGSTYSWSPTAGLTNPNIPNPVSSTATTTTYTVTVTSSCGTASDAVTVTVTPIAPPHLGADTTLCGDNSIMLNAGSGYSTYLWSTGATTQTITLDTTGIGLGVAHVTVNVTKGTCSDSGDIHITFIDCSGIAENKTNASFRIFPNPTTGMITITVSGLNSAISLSVFDPEGRQLYSESISGDATTPVDLSSLPKGVYVIRMSNDRMNMVEKLVKQ